MIDGSGGDWKEWSRHVLMEIKRLNEELKNINEEQKTMAQILAVNTKQLEIHIEGVRLAREQNDLLRKEVEVKVSELADRVKPIETRHIQTTAIVWTITKVIAALLGVPTLAFGILRVIELFQNL